MPSANKMRDDSDWVDRSRTRSTPAMAGSSAGGPSSITKRPRSLISSPHLNRRPSFERSSSELEIDFITSDTPVGAADALPMHDELTSLSETAEAVETVETPAGMTEPLTELLTEEEFDIQQHKKITAQRNFDKVNFGHWQIKTWYFSPYPLTESELDSSSSSFAQAAFSAPSTSIKPTSASSSVAPKIPGVNRTTLRSHGRTSDILAGGLGRTHLTGERSTLWVCDRCFKYMSEGAGWEAHVKKCTLKHPPGRKVYQRGAHTIWEVDGAKEKLYCQNLSLFGKLFIDVKTLFFDCDNFLFYLLTDADSQRDYVLGFFSKEKISYDDYNLACIIVLPPYQRKGYGMLMIEFSYELSARTNPTRLGTPERPLSELGLRSYLTYWVAVLVRYFRRLLSVLPSTSDGLPTATDEREHRRKRLKGWVGEVPLLSSSCSVSSHGGKALHGNGGMMMASHPSLSLSSTANTLTDPNANANADPNGNENGNAPNHAPITATIHTSANPDGSATSHVLARCTLGDIARATGLRVEDAGFGLREGGFMSVSSGNGDGEDDLVVITREAVEKVAKERKVKNMCMDLACVLL